MADCLEDGTMEHELLQCGKNDGVGILLVSCLQQHVQDIDHNRILRLEFAGASIKKYKFRTEIEQAVYHIDSVQQ